MQFSVRMGAIFGLLLFFLAATLDARAVQSMRYEELFAKSDLVLIASLVDSRDTDETTDYPGIYRMAEGDRKVGDPAVGVETRFKVRVVLKGGPASDEVTLHHYRYRDEGPVWNGPIPVQVIERPVPRSYLLFLVREEDGRYAPTSGQTDPGLNCVQPLALD